METQVRVAWARNDKTPVGETSTLGAELTDGNRSIAMHALSMTVLASAGLSAVTGYLTSRISQRSQRVINSQTYRVALLAEVRALHQRLLEYEAAFAGRVMTGQVSGAQVLKVLMQAGDTVVFNNNTSSIGLFDRRTALRIVRFYADIRSLYGRALVLSELADMARSSFIEAEMQHHLLLVRRLRRRAYVLVRRIRRQQSTFSLPRLRRAR